MARFPRGHASLIRKAEFEKEYAFFAKNKKYTRLPGFSSYFRIKCADIQEGKK
jgi:hypothetical protein